MRAFRRVVHALSTLAGILASVLVAAAVAVVCQMVLWRYVLGLSTVWQTEFVTYSVVAATFLGTPYVLCLRGHVSVELLPHWLGPRGRRRLGLLAHALGLLFAAVLLWQSVIYWLELWTEGWTTETVWTLPLWIPVLPLPLGAALLTLQYLADLGAVAAGLDDPFPAAGRSGA